MIPPEPSAGQSPAASSAPQDTTCPACAASAAPGQRFCGSCGAKLARTCPTCGIENPLKFQFCGGCGDRLEARPADAPPQIKESPGLQLREERRWATLLFADLSGFTRLSEQLDPEDVKALAHRCTKRLGEEVQRFGGTVVTIAGDQVFAAFGAPVAHEDDAERAVRAALAMRDCLLEDHQGRRIQIHAGLNTGEVMAGLIGPQGRQDYAVMGDTTNVAARLMSAAPPGGVLVAEETWRATHEFIAYRELPPLSAKGKQQPVRVWEALEVLAAPKSRPLGTAPLVGRDEELGVLSATWLRVVRDSRPHLVSVLGEPGIGKSRLVAEFEKRFCE
jgi:class 3 adenylate cyclase